MKAYLGLFYCFERDGTVKNALCNMCYKKTKSY